MVTLANHRRVKIAALHQKDECNQSSALISIVATCWFNSLNAFPKGTILWSLQSKDTQNIFEIKKKIVKQKLN